MPAERCCRLEPFSSTIAGLRTAAPGAEHRVDTIWCCTYIQPVEVFHTDEFREWWDALSEDEQEDVARVVELLRGAGVLLNFLTRRL
jgi:hypothetical protein